MARIVEFLLPGKGNGIIGRGSMPADAFRRVYKPTLKVVSARGFGLSGMMRVYRIRGGTSEVLVPFEHDFEGA